MNLKFWEWDWKRAKPGKWLNLTSTRPTHPGAILLVSILGLALLIYTGSRTLRLIDMTLPADAQPQGWAALFALDIGLLFWVFAYTHTERRSMQRAISGLMIVVSLLGVIAAMVADTWLQASHKGTVGKVSDDLASNAIWAVTIVIALNVAAVVGMHLAHSEEAATLPPSQLPLQDQLKMLWQVERPPEPPALPTNNADYNLSQVAPDRFESEAPIPFEGTAPLKSRNGKKP